MMTAVKRIVLVSAIAIVPFSGVAIAASALNDGAPQTRSALQAELQSMELPSRDASPEAQEDRTNFLAGADANGDGNLTKQELEAQLSAQFGRMDRNGDGSVNMKDAPRLARQKYQEKVGPVIARADTNGDNAMSYDEFSSGPLARFSALDEDGSGSIDLSALANDDAIATDKKGA